MTTILATLVSRLAVVPNGLDPLPERFVQTEAAAGLDEVAELETTGDGVSCWQTQIPTRELREVQPDAEDLNDNQPAAKS